MPPDANVHVGVASIVLKPDPISPGHIVMLQRDGKTGVSRHGRGTWSVPGGWIDYGEQPAEAAVREVKEEVGLDVAYPRFVGHVTNTHPDERLHVVCLVFAMDYLGGKLVNMEPDKAAEVRWVPVNGVLSYPLFAPLQTFVEQGGLEKI